MRARILIPILALLVLFCGVLGFAVYSNVSAATTDLLNKQLDNTLRSIENDVIQGQSNAGSTSNSRYQEIVEGYGVADGGVLVVDDKGLVIADSQKVMLAQNVSSEDWYNQAKKDLNSEFTATFGQTEIYAHSVYLNNRVIVSYLSTQSITELFETPLYVIGVVGVISVVIVGILIYFVITRLVINPVESLDDQLRELEKGETLDLKPLKHCPEVAEVANLVNKVLGQQAPRAVPAGSSQQAVSDSRQAPQVVPAGSLQQAPQVVPAGNSQQADLSTRFEFAQALREAFAPHQQRVIDEGFKFSLLVGNDIPKWMLADYDRLVGSINSALGNAFNKAQAGTKIQAKAELNTLKQTDDTNQVDIIFKIYYNGYEDSVLLEAKRG